MLGVVYREFMGARAVGVVLARPHGGAMKPTSYSPRRSHSLRAGPPTLALRPPATAADDASHRHGSFTGADGVALFEQSWHPRGDAAGGGGDPPRAQSHSDHYAPFAARLVARGLAVYAYDMRGHGRSAGQRATLDRVDALLDDLGTFLDRVRAREPGRPVFLLGHSAGARR